MSEARPLRAILRELSARRRARRRLVEKYGPTRYYGRSKPTITAEPRTGREAAVAALVEERMARRERRIQTLIAAQGPRCYLCTAVFERFVFPTIDHVTPKALGGKNHRNMLLACKPCNAKKADRPPTLDELNFLAEVNARLDAMEELGTLVA